MNPVDLVAERRQIGAAELICLRDGAVSFGADLFPALTSAELQAALPSDEAEWQITLPVNVFLWRDRGRTVLFDTGCGSAMGASGGLLPRALAQVGVRPETVDGVVLTHMHPDHSSGLTDRTTGRPLFPAATLHVARSELAYWFDDAAMAGAAPREQALYFQESRAQVAPYLPSAHRFEPGAEVFPGLQALAAPGHTPGHTAFRLGDVLIIGDLFHAPALQLARPEAWVRFDVDGPTGIASRRRLLSLARRDRLTLAGMHMESGFQDPPSTAG
ncbi:MBL fold metallo-hydrolase [Pararhodobacter aggregans]|uniref:MBL fold metallo-hydrolase n=1 Tax=Pararhodobacter aggregans TaxID=404875 RepID=A0A2T7UM05_9RHOB|nr:MBL fold metallo-hydrolase [Pararhodobacter aggregans]PTW99969.1 glyoxylase-like metal-dependent hydrolase (beta-lactamase superfamily II) [Pararhodobacter aggregans]PVE45725.1 MBL fold metallo-hydrolase [Pararhodobacter aggregans]